jgi:hypothetical protein
MRRVATLSLLLVVIVHGGAAIAYDGETHAQLAVKSASREVSSIDRVLKFELGLSGGVTTTFRGVARPGLRRVDDLIGDGALSEDTPSFRSLNHFHNPLIDPWDAAGLRAGPMLGPALVRGQSSVLWQQNDDQPSTFVFTPVPLPSLGGRWSWQDARRRYLAALTRPSRDDTGPEPGRDRAFGELFETLGHLTHLVQDAFVPAHARNDVHPPRVRSDWYEQWVEETRVARPDRFAALLNAAPRGPEPSIFTPTPTSRAPVPVARLIDADVFRAPADAGVLGDEGPGIGAAEYTNGNFLSRGTLFRRFELPQAATLDVGPIVEETPGTFRRYFTKSRDGAVITHFVTDGMLFDALAAAQAGPVPSAGWMLDDRVHEDYARALLPRAVGYGAALLDYFFRGRLDVRLADDGTARMVGTNATAEPLGGGTLSVYAETPDGTRTLAGSAAVGTVAPGGALPDVRLTAPEGAERFVAVYEGTLGAEVAVGQVPGAVAGKVVGGVRVEEVFTDGASWLLRTPDRAVALPFTPNEYVDVRWAEGENVLIARTPFGIDLPNEVVVFEVLRAPDSITPLTLSTPEGERVQVVGRERVRIPLDLPVGTTVELQQTIRYRQQLGRFERAVTFTAVECGIPPRVICYHATGEDIGPVIFDNVVDVFAPFTVTIPLVLDAAHNVALSPDSDFAFEPAPYFWDLVEVRRDRAGRLLGLVKVTVTQPGRTAPRVLVPLYEVDRTGALTQVRQLGLAPFFPSQVSPLWVLVDLTQGQVIGSTAGPRVVVTSAVTHEGEPWGRLGISPGDAAVWSRDVRVFVGGETPGTETTDWFRVSLGSPSPAAGVGGISDLQVQLGQGGFFLAPVSSDALAADQLRPELATALGSLLAPAVTTAATSRDLAYACHSFSGLCSIVRVQQTVKDLTAPGVLREGRLAGAAERLVLLASQPRGTASTETLAFWDRAAAGARLLVSPVTGFYALDGVATAGALATLFSASDFSVVSGSILSLDPARPSATVAGQDLGGAFALLEPSYLYGVSALKFFETTPALQATTLPAALAPVAGNPVGDYHAISVP